VPIIITKTNIILIKNFLLVPVLVFFDNCI
jgi:hypothetical protein